MWIEKEETSKELEELENKWSFKDCDKYNKFQKYDYLQGIDIENVDKEIDYLITKQKYLANLNFKKSNSILKQQEKVLKDSFDIKKEFLKEFDLWNLLLEYSIFNEEKIKKILPKFDFSSSEVKIPNYTNLILDKEKDCEFILSIYLSNSWKNSHKNKGNVCVASCWVKGIFYITTNSFSNLTLNEYQEKTKNFNLDIFNTDPEKRKPMYQDVIKKYESQFDDYLKKLLLNQSEEVIDEMNKMCKPYINNSDEDSILNSLKSLLQQISYISLPNYSNIITQISLNIELLAIIYPIKSLQLQDLWKNTENLRVFLNDYLILNHSFLNHLIKRKARKNSIEILTNITNDLLNSIMKEIKKIVFPNYFQKLRENLFKLKVENIKFINWDDVSTKTIHCEIKLFYYLKFNGLYDPSIKFYIEKPCCLDCTYFFIHFINDPPQLLSYCCDSFDNKEFLLKEINNKERIKSKVTSKLVYKKQEEFIQIIYKLKENGK